MRIKCKVSIQNRLLPALNMNKASKSSQSSLAIGCHPGSDKVLSNLYIHVCTLLNKQGTKYKIEKNIETIFCKFIDEGKLTIRLKDPPHDLCVNGEPLKVRAFLKFFKEILQKRSLDKVPLSNLSAIKAKQISKTKMVINSQKDYPLRDGFPQDLLSLVINNVGLTRIEKRIGILRNLQTLDLSHNKLEEVPDAISHMKILKELILAHNKIKTINENFFDGFPRGSLTRLDLSYNELNCIPSKIQKLKSLVTLQVNNNYLFYLPPWIGNLHCLKELNASHNLLEDLPATTFLLSLLSLDISGNPLSRACNFMYNRVKNSFPTLRELAAVISIKKRLPYHPATLPATLCSYLDNSFYCPCGSPLFERHILCRVPLHLHKISKSFVLDANESSVPCLVPFCSDKCQKRLFT